MGSWHGAKAARFRCTFRPVYTTDFRTGRPRVALYVPHYVLKTRRRWFDTVADHKADLGLALVAVVAFAAALVLS